MADAPRVGPGGAAVRDDPPVANDWGLVVRPIGTIDVEPVPSDNAILTSVAPSLVPVVLLLADPTPLNPNRTGWSIFNSSTMDTIFVKATPAGPAVSNVFFTVAIPPQSYYEDPYHYVGEVTGVWSGLTGTALVTEYKQT